MLSFTRQSEVTKVRRIVEAARQTDAKPTKRIAPS